MSKSKSKLIEQHKLDKDETQKLYETYLNLIGSETALQTATDKVTKSQRTYTEEQKKGIQENLRNALTTFNVKGEYDKLGEAMNEAYTSGAVGIEELSVTLSGVLDKMDEETKQTFVKNLPADLKIGIASVEEMGGMINNLTAKSYVMKFGMNTSDVTKKIDDLKKKLQNLKFGQFVISAGVKSANGSVLLANGGLLGLPRLAPGGIVNNPGPGINYRGANIGERGAEAVVPLTNSQMMSQLGEAIARYVNIRAEIPVSIGNRQVAREIRYINADEDFAYNG